MDCGAQKKMRYRYTLLVEGKKCAYVLETPRDIPVEEFVIEKEIIE